jgi:succinate-semialdehyde dehydrogenase/glutarate-semialdehyde dehydrogenase
VEHSRSEEFLEKFKKATEEMVFGDPMKQETQIGPLYAQEGLQDVARQVEESIQKGATLVLGGKRAEGIGYFYKPTILSNVKKGMPVYDEETFGPVAAVTVAHDEDEAIQIANDTRFGLGASVFTQNTERAKKLIPRFRTSCVFINGFVKSDPRLPFGGIGISGYGRELSHYGIKEFVNIKTVWVR